MKHRERDILKYLKNVFKKKQILNIGLVWRNSGSELVLNLRYLRVD